MRLVANPYLVDYIKVQTFIPRTFRERWIEPLLHPVTVPFEPWVKETLLVTTKEVPSRHLCQMADTIFCHPDIYDEVKKMLKEVLPTTDEAHKHWGKLCDRMI
jgi:hypothetical protein